MRDVIDWYISKAAIAEISVYIYYNGKLKHYQAQMFREMYLRESGYVSFGRENAVIDCELISKKQFPKAITENGIEYITPDYMIVRITSKNFKLIIDFYDTNAYKVFRDWIVKERYKCKA